MLEEIMLRSIKDLHGCTVSAIDGDIGTVDQVYFDDGAWAVRYLVVKTGHWLRERSVLISPYSIKHTDPGSNVVHLNLTQQTVRDSPGVDTHRPVSRQNEVECLRHYNYPAYWGGPNLWGMGPYPRFDPAEVGSDLAPVPPQSEPQAIRSPDDVHLRSTGEVMGYRLDAVDGGFGHVYGFIYDDEAWAIRYLCIDTRSFWHGGKEILLAAHWIARVDWLAQTVTTELTRDSIRRSPVYDDSVPIHRSYEVALHEFYGKQGYWSEAGPTSLSTYVQSTVT
jgi:hypothetical protein